MKKLNKALQDSKKESLAIGIILICWLISCLFFSIYDLQISIAVVDERSQWARIIADYGEIPGYVIISLTLLIFSRTREEPSRKKNILYSVLTFIPLTYTLYRVMFPLIGDSVFFVSDNYLLIMISAIVSFLLMVIIRKASLDYFSRYETFTKITLIIAIVNPLFLVQTVKLLWGRVRFRDLLPDHSNYTPWFIPRGITGNYSFPSGHVAMGWMLLPLLFLIREKDMKIRITICFIIICWGIIVALGRVVIGAHYASDTLFSSGIAMLSYILLSKKYEENE
jgi:membrane-associated phospholipid phosphatase